MTLTEGPPQNADPGGMGTTERAYIPISFQTLILRYKNGFSLLPSTYTLKDFSSKDSGHFIHIILIVLV